MSIKSVQVSHIDNRTPKELKENPLKETLVMINRQSMDLRLLLSDLHISHLENDGVDMSSVDKMYKEFDSEIKSIKKSLGKMTNKMTEYWENRKR